MPYGFHLVTMSIDAAQDQSIQDLDVGPYGTQLGAVNTRETVPAGVGGTIPTVTARGNALLTAWATGLNTQQMTGHLIQDCVP
jgi:hypothetical protein